MYSSGYDRAGNHDSTVLCMVSMSLQRPLHQLPIDPHPGLCRLCSLETISGVVLATGVFIIPIKFENMKRGERCFFDVNILIKLTLRDWSLLVGILLEIRLSVVQFISTSHDAPKQDFQKSKLPCALVNDAPSGLKTIRYVVCATRISDGTRGPQSMTAPFCELASKEVA